jgi:UPF0176 protein
LKFELAQASINDQRFFVNLQIHMSEAYSYQAVAFYKYVKIEEAEVFVVKHLKYCQRLGIFGRILIADEGINGQLSGTAAQCAQYMADLIEDPRFAGTDFKIDPVERQAFSKIHVRYKPEIVHSGLLHIDPSKRTGKHLKPAEFKDFKNRDDVVVLDVRSNYEHHIGRFKGALTLDIENFRDFPDKVKELENLKDKTIVTYCTGGIKCEKASAYLIENGFKDVYQLEGGVIKYAHETGGEDFEGKLYVFDGRVVVDVNTVNPSLVSECVHCGKPSARMINCVNELCNEQIVMCEDCGWTWNGACSASCKEIADRAYDGTGYYTKIA